MTQAPDLRGPLSQNFLERHLWLITLSATTLLAPTVVDYSPMIPAWDDSYFLTSTLCVRNAVYGWNVADLYGCLAQVSKSPIIVFMGIPWGETSVPEIVIQTAFVSLALATFLAAITCLIVLLRLGTSLLALLLAVVCLTSNTFLCSFGGTYLIDGLFSFIVALALLLIPLEIKSPAPGVRASIARGAMWGGVVMLGVLSKITFGLFIALIGPVLLYLRWKVLGTKETLLAQTSAFVTLLPAFAMFIAFGRSYFSHAMDSSFGTLASFYNVEGMGPLGYFAQYGHYLGWGVDILSVLALLGVRSYSQKPRLSWWILYPVAVTLAYFLLTAMSPNRDFRFSMPVMVGLPLLLAATTAKRPRHPASLKLPALVAVLSSVLMSIPMMARPNLQAVQTARGVLTSLSDSGRKPVSVLIGSDAAHFNIETFRLAQQMEYPKLNSTQVGTLVYDFVNGRSLQQSLDRMDKSDYVLFQIDPRGAPAFTNHFLKEYLEYATKIGKKIDADPSSATEIFQIMHR